MLKCLFDSCQNYFIGPDAPQPIASMAMDGNAVWISSGPYVIKYIRGKEVRFSFNNVNILMLIITAGCSPSEST